MFRRVIHDGCEITYELTYKKVKNMNLRVKADGSVHVSVSRYVTRAQADEFVQRNADYILRAQERFAQRQEESAPAAQHFADGDPIRILGETFRIKTECAQKDSAERRGETIVLRMKDPENEEARRKVLKKYLEGLCRQVFSGAVERMLPRTARYGVVMPEIKYRAMKSRWGTCAVQKRIVTLNTLLIHLPAECIEYVALHELCHFVHPNHSREFHLLMTELMPDWKQRKAQLNANSLQESVLYSAK